MSATDQKIADDYHLKRQQLAEEFLIPKARDGDWLAISNLLSILADVLADKSPLTPACAGYLAEALRKLSDGDDHKEAFNIRRKKGETDNRKANSRAFINAYRIEYIRVKSNFEVGVEVAEAEVAEKTGITESSLRGHWKRYHKAAREELEMQQRCFGHLIPI